MPGQDQGADHRSEDGGQALVRQLRRLNLDLLPVLHEILRTRSVGRAARALGITQPAVSRALRELRAVFNDDLLVPEGRSSHLTDRGAALLGPLSRILDDIGALTRATPGFDPAGEALSVIIGTADYVTEVLAPRLVAIISAEAPRVTLEFIHPAIRGPEDLARFDFVIAPRRFGATFGKRVGRMALWRDDYVVIAGPANAHLPAHLSEADFHAARHVGFQTRIGMPESEGALVQLPSVQDTRRVCTVSNFLVMGAIVEATDCIGVVPRRHARDLTRWRDVRILDLDHPDARLDLDLCWAPGTLSRRGLPWVRDAIARATADLR